MQKTKKIFITGLIASIFLSLIACSPDSNQEADPANDETRENQVIRVSTSISPNSIPLFYMQEANLLGDDITLDIEMHKNRQESIAKINNNSVDLLNLSMQEIAHLYNKELPVHFLDVSNWATFKVMTLDENINTWEDLRGEKIYTGSKGGPVDILATTILAHNDLTDGNEIDIQHMKQGELSQMAANELKDIRVFILREPFASQAKLNNPNIKTLYDLGESWEEIHGHGFPQSGTAVTTGFLDNNQELAQLFTDKHQEAIDWVFDNPREAAEIGEKHLKSFSKEVLLESLENIDMYTLSSEHAREPLEVYYHHILEFNPEMIGHEMPDDDFYTLE